MSLYNNPKDVAVHRLRHLLKHCIATTVFKNRVNVTVVDEYKRAPILIKLKAKVTEARFTKHSARRIYISCV